ncbi:MAG TPA: Yip1 family protein [Ktedonobacteraceae bacterium]|nr:Yip1 family protein [Ktedonobacteraceae bacterium]
MARSPHQEKAALGQTSSSDQTVMTEHATSTSPLSAVLLRLPQYYFNALLKPSVETFARDNEPASWSLVLIQLLAWAILDAALGVLVNTISPPSTSTSFQRIFALATSYGLVIAVPMLFFLLMGIVYLLARYFGGQGTFLEQCNASLYVQAPLGILSKLLALIPGVGRILNSVLSLYGIVLQVFPIMAAHRLSRGKAIAAILIPLVTIGVLAGAVFLLMRK